MLWELFDLVTNELDTCLDEWKKSNPMYNDIKKKGKNNSNCGGNDKNSNNDDDDNDNGLSSSSLSFVCIRREIINNLPEPARTMYALLKDRLSILRDEWFHEAFPNSIPHGSASATTSTVASTSDESTKYHNENTIRFTLGVYTLVQCGLIRPKAMSGTGRKGNRQIKYEKVCAVSS